MVGGLDKFREFFEDFSEQYILIGGAACDVSFDKAGVNFRATKDLDIVLVIEALTKEFGQRFWQFIKEGKYQHRARSDGNPQFYRFERPEKTGFPKMIELFAGTETVLRPEPLLVPLHIDDSVSSLSAILLNEDYYRLLIEGRTVIDGISILSASYLIPFKVKAWLDLREKQSSGTHVDSRDIKKHRNDVLRIAAELALNNKVILPAALKDEMIAFIFAMREEQPDLKPLRLRNVKLEDIMERLEEIYC